MQVAAANSVLNTTAPPQVTVTEYASASDNTPSQAPKEVEESATTSNIQKQPTVTENDEPNLTTNARTARIRARQERVKVEILRRKQATSLLEKGLNPNSDTTVTSTFIYCNCYKTKIHIH
jgi:hypothetical protein